MRNDQSSVIAASLVVAFFVFITVRGELGKYFAVFTGAAPVGSGSGQTNGAGVGVSVGPGGVTVSGGGGSVSVGGGGGGGVAAPENQCISDPFSCIPGPGGIFGGIPGNPYGNFPPLMG